MTREITPDNREIDRAIDAALGDEWVADEYSDLNEEAWIYLISSPDRPQPGLTSFSTVGLSDFNRTEPIQPPLGIELTAASPRADFANVLASTAFFAIDNELPHPWYGCAKRRLQSAKAR